MRTYLNYSHTFQPIVSNVNTSGKETRGHVYFVQNIVRIDQTIVRTLLCVGPGARCSENVLEYS